MTLYRTVYADPPWMERGSGQIVRGAQRHYPLMSTDAICDLPIAMLADSNAHLYLWVTNNFLEDGLRVVRTWGFRYVTMITWAKDRIGLGQYFRGQTEHCIFAVRGNLPYKVADGIRQQGSTLITAPRSRHSEKPEEMRRLIERVSYEPRIELFARGEVAGWDRFGNEVQSTQHIEPETLFNTGQIL
jgi:N6-adenosine-specific RNA methylase IME4